MRLTQVCERASEMGMDRERAFLRPHSCPARDAVAPWDMKEEKDERTQERERAELHKTIWGIADKLRGAVSGWDFKQYVLGTLFYRFLSEKIARVADEEQRAAGVAGFSTMPVRTPFCLISCRVRWICVSASTWKLIRSAPASANASIHRDGFSIIR